LIVAVSLCAAAPALGQPQGNAEAKLKVSGLVKEAMDAYSNLDLAAATGALEEALGFSPDLDKATLARLYIAYGTIRIGGQGDNASGQRDFATALCLDAGVMIDPLMSTPDIDAVFTMAKQQATPANCPNVLSTIVMPAGATAGPPKGQAGDPGVPPCGAHNAPKEIKQRYELPLYMELDPAMRARLAKLVVRFSFDGSPEYKEIPVVPAGPGFGAQISCDEGQIRLYDPASISYYVEGYDRLGNLICGHATAQSPFVVAMTPEAAPLPGVPGLAVPKECAPCPPWDQACGQAGKPGDGAMCDPAVGCAQGFVCGEAGICEAESGGSSGPKGPKRFYVNLTGGAGVGVMSQKISFTEIAEEADGDNIVQSYTKTPSGFAFSGVPLRLVVGVQIIEKLAVEITGRLDLTKMATMDKNNQSCWDAAGGDLDTANELNCTVVDGMGPGGTPFDEEAAKKSVALTNSDTPVVKSNKHIANAWLVNARARYNLVQKGGLRFSLFAGLGYGHMIYMVNSGAGGTYYPSPGFFNIEVGPGLAYYFTDNVGVTVEVPIDVLVGDGWAVNFDLALGLSFGF
jgi:hypothetical protein